MPPTCKSLIIAGLVLLVLTGAGELAEHWLRLPQRDDWNL